MNRARVFGKIRKRWGEEAHMKHHQAVIYAPEEVEPGVDKAN